MNYSNLAIQESIYKDKEYIYNGIKNLKISLLNFNNVTYNDLKVYIIIKGIVKIIDIDTTLNYSLKNKNIKIDVLNIEPLSFENVVIKIQEIGFSKWEYKVIVLNKNKKIYITRN